MVFRCERLEYKRALGTLQNPWGKAGEPELGRKFGCFATKIMSATRGDGAS